MASEEPVNTFGLLLFALLIGAIVYMMAYGMYSMYISYETNRMIEEEISNIDPANQYGCPGCPDNFTDFANDMCSRNSDFTVSDGKNTVKCNSRWKR